MGMRYFKKFEPTNVVVLSNNSRLNFTSLDGLVGYFAHQDDWILRELDTLIAEGRYGLSEVSAEEFMRDYVKKKQEGAPVVTSPPIFREEFGRGQTMVSGLELKDRLERAGRVVAVVDGKVVPPVSSTALETAPTTLLPTSAPTGPVKDFTPELGRRQPKKKPANA